MKKYILLSIILINYSKPIFAENNCASITDPQLMFNCMQNQSTRDTTSQSAYPKGPLEVLFACSQKTSGAANFMAKNVLIELIKYGNQSASGMMQSYRCSNQAGQVSKTEFLQKSTLIGEKEGLLYYVINIDNEVSIGAVGN